MRVRGTLQDTAAVDLPTRRMALRAGLGLVAAAALPTSAWARGAHVAHAARSAHAAHAAHPTHAAYAAHALIKKPSRELSFLNLHTGERLRAEYVHNGQVVPGAMHAISVLMRDHYNNKIHPIDPHLLDIAHTVQSRVGSHGVFQVVCGYRSPETNAMMHRWTTRGDARLEMPGACPRHQHFADRAVHDVIERAWLNHFLDGWLARMPSSAMSEAAE